MAELFKPWLWKAPTGGTMGKSGYVVKDSYAKITGAAPFTRDISRPNMLYAKFYLSPYAHASIKSMDTTAVSALSGVVDVLRYDDKNISWDPGQLPPGVNNQASVLPGEAQYFSQPVGLVVVAESEYICDEALKLVKIVWEQETIQLDYVAALASGATLLRPDLNAKSNMRQEAVVEHGNVEEGFKKSDHVITWSMKIDEHTPATVEGLSAVVEFDHGGNCDVWFHGQGNNVAEEVAGTFTSYSKVNVHSPYNGGMFGGPISHGIEQWVLWPALIAAKRLRRPIKMIWDEAQFLGADEANGSYDFKVGFNNDGTIVAVSLESNWSGQLIHGEISKLWASTKIPNFYHHYVVPYLNRIVPGVFRDGAIASACQLFVMSHVAAELNMDPIKLATLNNGGESQTWDWLVENKKKVEGFDPTLNSLQMCIDAGKKAIGWDAKYHEPGKKLLANGKYHGMAFQWTESWLNIPYRRTRAGINIRYDGTVDVLYRRSDTGVNVSMCYAQVVADELGFKLDDVEYWPDRHNVGFDTMSEASSSGMSTNVAALVMVARKAKQNLLEHAVTPVTTAMFGMSFTTPAAFPDKTVAELDIKDSMIYEKAKPSNTVAAKKVVQSFAGWNPIFQHEYSRFFSEAESEYPAYMDTALGRQCHFIEVEVDPDTGKVEVTNMAMVNDVGKILNVDLCHGQQYGGASMGMGRSNAQEVVYDPLTGVKLNDNLCFYPVYAMNDMGPVSCDLIETGTGYSAYGATGIGESGCAVTMAMTHAAVYNAIGKWVNLPTTPDKVLKALGKA